MEIIFIIFLDIDGVLKTVVKKNFNRSLENLLNILAESKAKIVISSRWKEKGLDYIESKFPELKDYIIGSTKKLEISGSQCSVPRGLEIKDWIDSKFKEGIVVLNYVILDDKSDMLLEQKDNFVKIDSIKGIDSDAKLKILGILSKNYRIMRNDSS